MDQENARDKRDQQRLGRQAQPAREHRPEHSKWQSLCQRSQAMAGNQVTVRVAITDSTPRANSGQLPIVSPEIENGNALAMMQPITP
jgi:hypothetical protein